MFCNQNHIAGKKKSIDASTIKNKITKYLRTVKTNGPVDVAFYGGSFTSLQIHIQNKYLESVYPFIETGQIRHIRLSTRPDAIDCQALARLKEYHVQTIELGIQSMKNSVLLRSGRGHTVNDAKTAVKLLKKYNFDIGLQIMAGMPGDSASTFMNTVRAVIRLKPDFVRIYPLLVLKDTPLEKLYNAAQYNPLSLDMAVLLCRNALVLFEQAGIDVIRIGLQADEELQKPGIIRAGPYHPAFRQLVESSILLDKMRSALHLRKGKTLSAVFAVPPEKLSSAIGQHRSNIEKLKSEFNLKSVRIVKQNHLLTKRDPLLIPIY